MVVLQVYANGSSEPCLVLPNVRKSKSNYAKWLENDKKQKTTEEQQKCPIMKSNWQDGNPLGKLAGHIFRFLRPAARKQKPDVAQLLLSQMKEFFCLLENDYIKKFLMGYDRCHLYADRYLLAMVFTYFVRAGYRTSEYNFYNFFVALMLAHDVEEDIEDMKVEFLPWALGVQWRTEKHLLFKSRDQLFQRIDYRALVSRRCCEAIMNECPDHWAWQRHRYVHHGGVDRDLISNLWNNGDEYFLSKWYPRGPWYSQLPICQLCNTENRKLANNRPTEHIGRRLSLKKRQRDSTRSEPQNKICRKKAQ